MRNIIISIIQRQARFIIWRYRPRIIAVTGSVGKTGTKDAVYAALSGFFHVRKNKKSFNSEIGVPLTIIGAPTGWRDLLKWVRNVIKGFWVMCKPFGRYPKWLVLEVGVGKPGDMAELQQWVQPDIVVVTAFGDMPSHVEFFGSKEDVWAEEASIIDGLKPNGVLVLNRDDERVYELRNMTKARIITFGTHPDSDVMLEHPQILYSQEIPQGFSFHVSYKGKSLPVSFEGVLGKSLLYYVGAALAVVESQDLNMIEAIQQLEEKFRIPLGRGHILAGIHESVLIDDSYNSSPPALGLALDALNEMKIPGRKIAVLGDMLELGKFSDEEHEKLGKRAAGVCDELVTVGVRARHFGLGADQARFSRAHIHEFDSAEVAGAFLKTFVRKGDCVLVKGSQGARTERVLESLLRDEDSAAKVLVRQEREWKAKP